MVQNKTINEQLDATSRSYEWEIKNTPSKSKKESWKIREKIINILNDMDIELLFTEIKDKQGKKFELSDEFMELYNIFWDYVKDRLIKQLQKEIGGNEK